MSQGPTTISFVAAVPQFTVPDLSLGSAGTETKSVKRTAEKIRGSGGYHSAVRFTDYKYSRSFPQQ